MDEIDFANNPFDKIDEVDEYSIELEDDKEIDPHKLIVELQEKIVLLEKENKDLKKKVETIKKKDVLNSSIINKMSMVGLRRNFTLKKNVTMLENDPVKVAEIIKEKEDLLEINNEILDMITKKEIENDELNQQYENYILKTQIEKDKLNEQIKNLKENIDNIKLERLKDIEQYEDNFKEYNKYKEQLKKEINEYIKIKDDLNNQIKEKDIEIEKLKYEIQDLQFENLSLINKSNEQKKINQAGYMDLEKYSEENYKIKCELNKIKDDLDKKNKELINLEKDKNKQIEKCSEEIQMLKNDIKKKSDKMEELNKQKSDLESNNKQIYILLKKNENLLNEEINKNNIIQEKLKSKTSELKSMQEIYKNFQTTNKKQLKDYEDKIDELTKNKDDLVKQNTDLLEKLKQKMGESSGLSLDGLVESSDKESQDEMSVYINENKLLKEEINKLKEQISDQAHDLVQMNSLEKNLEKIKLENEALINNNKELSEKYNKLKNDYDELSNQNNDNNINDIYDTNKAHKTCIFTKKEIPELKRMKAFRSVLNLSLRKSQKSSDLKKEKDLLEHNFENLKKLKEEKEKEYEDKIEKIGMELMEIKANLYNKEIEENTMFLRYKNFVNEIKEQCKHKGIKLSFNAKKLFNSK